MLPAHHSWLTRFAAAYLVLCLTLTWQALLPDYFALASVGLSLLAYLLYAIDKRAARLKRWRVSEQRLHVVALLGGWPGAALARQRLRHKTRKPSFSVMLWLSALLHIGFIAAYLLVGHCNPSYFERCFTL